MLLFYITLSSNFGTAVNKDWTAITLVKVFVVQTNVHNRMFAPTNTIAIQYWRIIENRIKVNE